MRPTSPRPRARRQSCDLLQAAGCDVDEADNDGHSPQMLAVFGGADFILYADQDSTSIEELKSRWTEEEEEKEQARLAAEEAAKVCTLTERARAVRAARSCPCQRIGWTPHENLLHPLLSSPVEGSLHTPMSPACVSSVWTGSQPLACPPHAQQKRPTYIAKETYIHSKRGLLT